MDRYRLLSCHIETFSGARRSHSPKFGYGTCLLALVPDIGRDDVVDLVVGNWGPGTVHFNFMVVAKRYDFGSAYNPLGCSTSLRRHFF
jgi:hypothetical protein